METLKNHKLLIDKECPMCRIYGGAFEKYNYVEKGTCFPYQNAGEYLTTVLDAQKARNEIALVNTDSNEVIYGVDALTKILTLRFPFIGKVMKISAIRVFFQYLYKFISQNRKVIAPSKNTQSVCVPDVQLKYRFLFLIFVAIFSSVIIYTYMYAVNLTLGLSSNFGRELVICFGQLFWQYLFLNKILKSKTWEYMGNLSTVSLIGTLLLLPGLFFSIDYKIGWFAAVVLVMALLHLRRSNLLQIGVLPTVSWLVYRGLVLLFLFI